MIKNKRGSKIDKSEVNDSRRVKEFLFTMAESIDHIGLVQTTQILKRAKDSTTVNTDLSVANYVISTMFKMAPDAMFSKARKYPRKYAFAIWAFIAMEKLKYSLKDIHLYCKASESTISKGVKLMREFPNNTKLEKEIHSMFEKCIEKVNNELAQRYSSK